MLSKIQRNIIIRALRIRKQNGEDPAEAVKDYVNLPAQEQAEGLAQLTGGCVAG